MSDTDWTPPPGAVEAATQAIDEVVVRAMNDGGIAGPGEAAIAALVAARPLLVAEALAEVERLSRAASGLLRFIDSNGILTDGLFNPPTQTELEEHVARLRAALADHADTLANVRAAVCVNVVAHRHPDDCAFYRTTEGTDHG